jgi:hypothetical protein
LSISRKCLGADILSIWIYSDGVLEKMLDFCGHELPPSIMSNSHRLMLEFKGASNAHFSRGFHANYAFLEGWLSKINKLSFITKKNI